ncbi:PREDICTED: centromere protein H-like [Nanorana parkeri]|uniref:centromere protein H-like n=1 Tax=Nanorana parkeri TaxID=125878 RepID=UPI000854240A|nr:PREDICTED: centromere protein H-like [Nanorana parkeri]
MSSKTPRMKTTKRKENRDRMPEILVQLHNASVECLKSCLPNTQGSFEGSPEVTKGPKAFMQLIWFKKQMQQQLKDMKTDLITRGLSKEDIDCSFNVSLSVARDPLDIEMCSVINKELALERMQTFNALLIALQIDSTQRLSISAVMRHSADTCKQILAVQLSNRQLGQQLTGLRKRRLEIRIRQQDLFRKLRYSRKTDHKIHDIEMKAFATERENLESLLNEVIILQDVFQRIVMSVQLHWAENPHLRSLLLRMKDPCLY